MLVVPPSMPIKDVRALIALAKSRPGELTYASGGNGTSNHLAGALLGYLAGVQLTHVPYKGAGQAMTDLLSGQVPVFLNNFLAGAPMIKAGRLRALAVTGARRSSAAPVLPTVMEAGVPGYAVTGWYGMMVPAATPATVLRILDRKSTRLNSSHVSESRMPSSA